MSIVEEELKKRPGKEGQARHSQWVGWTELAMGLALATMSGLWVGRAWSDRNWLLWAVGAASLLCGVLLAMVGMRASSPRKGVRHYQPPPPRRRERAMPYLGELLVHKHQLISEKQLQEALAEQRRRGGRLGQIMVAMGFLDHPKLSEVLEDQLSYRDPRRSVAGGAKRNTAAAVETK